MVAVVNGSGLGLFTSLGSNGSAGLGQTRERVFVNSTTGNLIIQNVDELLSASGNDLAITRTYNSLGLVDGDNNDGWRIGVLRSLSIIGSATAPDRIVKTFGDGAQITYLPSGGGVYRSTEGDGAHDTLQLVSGQWIWTDGSAHNTEYYNSNGQIVEARDADGNRFTYGYTGTLITTIIVVSPTADGSNPGEGGNGTTTTISLEYLNPTTTKQLQRIRVARSGDAEQVLTSYAYDGLGRLETVTVDLTPENTSDSSTYITTYGYEGNSNRVGSITQNAGGSSNVTARVSFSYIEQDGAFRLRTYTDGEGHVTTFTYTLANGGGGSGTTLPADNGVLSTTETQNVSNNYTLTGAASTTDTQSSNTTHTVINSQITTGATQTATYNRNDAALSTTDTQTTTDTYNVNNAQITPAGSQTDSYTRIDSALSTTKTTNGVAMPPLNSGLLTTPTAGAWGTAALLEGEPAGSTASAPQIAFDGSGNGFAIWVVTTSSTSVLKTARYTRSTNTWASSPTTLYSSASGTPVQASLAIDSAGNALVAWLTGAQISARRYSSGSWAAATTVVSSGATVRPTVSINGNFAAVMWGEGSVASRAAYVARWSGTAWTAKVNVENQSTAATELNVAVDNQGNVLVAYTQVAAGETVSCVWTNRYSVSANSWSGPVTRDTLLSAATSPQIALDANGNAWMTFAQGTETLYLRYTRSSNTWTTAAVLDNLSGNVSQTSLAVDASGNAVIAWVQETSGVNSAYASVYNATTSTMGPVTLLETLSTTVASGSLKASMQGSRASVIWLQNDGTRDNTYATTFDGTTWRAAAAIESSTQTPTAPAVAIDSLGNAIALWIQSNGTAPSLYVNQFNPGSGSGAPYYSVPAGATWQSIALTLYNDGRTEAGEALRIALGNPTLSTGLQLSGFPDPLTFSISTTFTVPPYYKVPAGATWQSIANLIYGINSAAAGAALQTAMGNPALATNVELTNFPATITISQSWAAHYLVPAGATWQSIASALYGINSAAAGTALQTALGNPSISAGARLVNIPATLTVTVTGPVTVPPYYSIPSGASWQSIANAIYGINSAAAGSALQTAMGNPPLTAGNRLTSLPATISIVTSLAPHYLVPAGATWQSVAYALYGVNSAEAGARLQTVLSNPALTTGARLYSIPSSLTVTTISTITVPPYYVIPSSPGWQSIANTLYGINSAAAGSALQSALGNPTLTPGNRLNNLPATLTVVTQQTVTVPPYYTVPAGATWTSITQAVYHTSDTAAVAALQAATGNPTLTTGLHLTVPANLTYSTATASSAARQPTYVVSQETTTVHHSDAMTATLSTTQEITTPTDFDLLGARLETTEVRPNERAYNLTGASTTVNESRTFGLTGALSYPPKGWGVVAAQTVAGSTAAVSGPKIEFDGSGNGIAVWMTTSGTTQALRWARYDATTKTWGAMQSQVIATNSSSLTQVTAISNYALAVDSVTGRAVLCWAQSVPGGVNPANQQSLPAGTVYVSTFNPATNTWATSISVGQAIREFRPTVAMRNGIAAVSYTTSIVTIQNSGAGNDTDGYRAFVSRFNGSSWTQAENRTGSYSSQLGTTGSAIGVDSDGNIHVSWTEGSVSGGKAVYQRWNGSSWLTYPQIASVSSPSSATTGEFGANGDGFVAVAGVLYRYVKATGIWSTQSVPVGFSSAIDVDEAGRAAVAVHTGTSLSVYTFDGSTWSGPALMSGIARINSATVAMRNGRAIVSWNEASGSNGVTYARTFEDGAWGTAQQIGTSIGGFKVAGVGLDSTADMHVLWALGSSSTSYTLTGRRFISAVNAPGYITLDGDPTWQEIAFQMYGQNYSEAGERLRIVMGSPSLQPLGTLTGFPQQLTFTANFPTAPYYDIPDGNLQTAANALYSNPNRSMPSPEGRIKLEELIFQGVITRVGNRLTGMPASINLTAPELLPAIEPYYIVPNGATWRSMAAFLYNIDSDAAGVVLRGRMNGPADPVAGAKILRSALPATIRVDVISTQGTTPYYQVPQSTTWADITSALYGAATAANPEAVAALIVAFQNADPPVNSIPFGGKLRGMPGTLLYDTLRTDNVTPYYVVVAGDLAAGVDSWTTIAQKVYGVPADPAAGIALRALLGNPSLSSGVHLLVPANLSYVPTFGGNTVYQQTDVTDALNLQTTYKATVQGRLTSTLSPTVNGARIETRYDYDLDGNLTSVTLDPGGLNRVTAMTYDANGNMKSSRDAAGNTVARDYDLTTNLLQSETVYLVPDPDGFGTQTAQSPQITRFFYDGENHLRFTVSADGRVVENRYFNAGTRRSTHVYGGTPYSGTMSLAALNTWATNRTPVELTEYTYDFRGNIASAKRYETTDANGAAAGTPSITAYVYDPRGNLITVIDPRGTATTGDLNDFKTSYLYDGLGRLKQKVEWLSGTDARTTLNNYQDTLNNVVTTISSSTQPVGRVTTTTYDKSGIVTTVSNADTGGTSFGQTLYAYDLDNRLRMVTDPTGVRSYVLYDNVGRKSGEVDAEGRLTRYAYNRAGQVIKAVRYSNALSSTALATLVSAGVPANVTVESLLATLTLDATRDQTSRLVYDKAGRLVYSIDAGGSVTRNIYDGAHRVTEVVSYATTLSIAASIDELDAATISVPSSSSDRHQRNFYNADGMLVATLDGGGYLVEFVYDSFGHLQRQIGYAAPTTAADRAAGSLATLRASADDTPAADVNSYFYYDGQGRLVGVLDAEGFLTESKYDLAGNVAQKIRYEKSTTYNASLATVRTAATGPKNQSTTYAYDGASRLINSTNFEGTPSSFTYNAFDQVTSATLADRTTQKRYNAMGWVTQELSGEGSLRITGGMTPAQIEAIWTQWAMSHSYDSAGRRKLTTDQYGNRTWYYYDVDGRARYAIRDLGNNTGEVTESRYNALGQLTETIVYSGRMGMTSIGGGLVNATVTNAVNAIANASNDAHEYLTYKVTGDVASQRDQTGAQTDYSYNAFGEVTNQFEKQTASVTTEHRYGYDNRGLQTSTRWDPTGIDRTEGRVYDAFGRLKSTVDQSGRGTSSDYDRLGRVVATHAGIAGEDARFEYDAFGRVLRSYDAYNQLTTFVYEDAFKRSIMTTPEGVVVTNTHYATGETLSVIDSDGRGPTYTYNKDGQLTGISDGGGTLETRTYDRDGRLDLHTDGRGVNTRFAYDAASRVFTRTQDEGGLALLTRYDYDGQGRVIRVTEPNNRVTETAYYTDGRIKQIAVDPATLNLRTYFEYDLSGNAVKMVEGYQSSQARTTVYLFDTLGRRYEEVVDPTTLGGTLDLHTQYKYDAHGNLTRKIDASGYSTWYVYDADNRLQYTVNALGNVTRQTYDLNGRVIAATRYATPVTVASFGNVVSTLSPTSSANDHIERTVYDRDGRAVYTIDAIGTVAERSYDASGNVTRLLQYSRGIAVGGTYTSISSVVTALAAAGNTAGTPGVNDQVNWTAYDLRGRAKYFVDSRSLVIRNKYDGGDNVLESRAYATAYTGTRTLNLLDAWATGSVETNTANRTTLHRYDGAGREKYTIDAQGGVTEYTYDGIGNVTRSLSYSKAISTSGALDTFVQIQTALGTAGNSATDAIAAQRVQWIAYDAAGRAEFTVDSIDGTYGSVKRAVYDAVGNIQHTQAFAVRRLISAATDVATLRSWASANFADGDHVSSYWFDAAGRQRFAMDAEGFLTETRFNDANNSVTSVGYALDAATQGLARSSTLAQVTATTALSANNVGAHVESTWRDAAGRERFRLDAERYLTETRYNDAGLQQTRYEYGGQLAQNRLTATSSLNDAAAAAGEVAFSAGTGNAVETFDAADRLTRITYSLDGSSDVYGYDAFGNKTSYTNQKSSVWNYVYDSAGNLLEEVTPPVALSVVSAGDTSALTLTPDTARIVTKMTYDIFGGVQTRTEGVRRYTNGNPDTTAGSRLTSYGYDRLGRQTSVTLPTLSVYSAPNLDEQNIDNATMRRETTPFTPVTTVTYDALGNAVMNVDVGGAYSHKAFDNLGRVVYEVDALNKIIKYEYDAFGNKTGATRYAGGLLTGLTQSSAWTLAEIIPKVQPGSADRKVTTAYDHRNLQISVLQPQADVYVTVPTTPGGNTVQTAAGESKYKYDAFGQVTSTQVLVDPTPGALKYLTTYFFYDGRGNQTYKVDAQGYVTRQEFDSRGNATRVTEFAQALISLPPGNPPAYTAINHLSAPNAASGYDRDMRMTYDTLGRMTSRSMAEVETSQKTASGIETTFQTQTTSFTYDAVGNQTSESNALGATYTYYDVLGRVIAIAEPTRNIDGTATVNATPLTELLRDVYGNIVSEIRYATSTSATLGGYTVPGGARQQSFLQYDLYGHATRTTDSAGANRFVSYDVRGNVAKEWQPVTTADNNTQTLVTIHEYDAVGREIATITPLRRSDALPQATTAARMDTMRLSQNYVPPEWTGENAIQIVWPQQPVGSVRVDVTYVQYSRNQADGPTVTRSETFSNVTEQAVMRWTENGSAENAGVLRIVSVVAWKNVNGTLVQIGTLPTTYLTIGYSQKAYNAFGEVTKEGTNLSRQSDIGNFQVLNEYDNAGHLWRTNAGDGARKIYYYDAAGRRTAEVTARGTTDLMTRNPATALTLTAAEGARVENVFNGIDQLVEQRLPRFTAANGSVAAPSQKRDLDRWGNVVRGTDTAAQTTLYRYNVLGELLEAKQPQVSILDTRTSFTAVNGTPTVTNYYDLYGRLIAMRDANGNLNWNELNAAGQLLVERHADGGAKTFSYDIYGNQTLIVNEIGKWVVQAYDNANRLTQVKTQYSSLPDGAGGVTRSYLVRDFTYDAAGRRISETSGETKADGTPEKTLTFYDNNGNVSSRRTAMGATSWFEYDIFGNLVSQKDAAAGQLKWTYDAFGHVQTHTDMSGVVITYTYDAASLLDKQTAASIGQNIDYDYDSAGHLIKINDTGVGRVTNLGYDTAGRRVREQTIIASLTHDDVSTTYDALGRESTLTGLRWNVTYQYDSQGNRTRTNGNALDHNNVWRNSDLWYTYDSMNRVKLSQAEYLVGVLTVNEKQGASIFYDLAGRRTEVDQYGTDMLQKTDNWNSSTQSHEISYRSRFGYYRETYYYDDANRITGVARSGEFQNLVDGRESGLPTLIPLDTVLTRNYDNASRMIREDSWRTDNTTTLYSYDDDGRLVLQTTRTLSFTTGSRDSETEFHYDDAGVQRWYTVSGYGRNPTTGAEVRRYISSYQNSYLLADTYLLASQSAVSVQGPDAPLLGGLTTRTYNANRELVSQIDTKNTLYSRWFFNNANGEVMTVVGGSSVNAGNVANVVSVVLNGGGTTYRPQHFFYANGQSVGSFGNVSRGNPNDNIVRPNFDVNFTKSLDQVNPTQVSEAVVRANDTLRTIAARYLGDSNLWYLIAEENGLSNPDATLAVGLTLRLPNEVISLSNSAGVFKPFDPSRALDPMTPHMVVVWKPPGPNRCAEAAMIVVIVFFIVVAVYTMGTAAAAADAAAAAGAAVSAGSVAMAAGSAAISSVFMQAAFGGMAVLQGGRFSFDWRSVAAAALTAGITNGLGPAISGMASSISSVPAVQQAITGVAQNVIGQGVNILLKTQSAFDWKGVAFAAVTAPISGALQKFAGSDPGNAVSFVNSTVFGFVQTMARGGKVDVQRFAMDAFGNLIASAVASSLSSKAIQAEVAEAERLNSLEENFLRTFNENHPDAAEEFFSLNELTDSPKLDSPSPILAALDANSVVEIRPSRVVERGDTYAGIAKAFYGDERYTSAILMANGVDPTYGELHGLQVGRELLLPNLNSATPELREAILKTGTTILTADQAVTDEIARAREYERMVDLATNHPNTFGGTVAISKLTGLSFDEVIEQRNLIGQMALNNMTGEQRWDMVSAISGIPNLPRAFQAAEDGYNRFMNNPATVRTLGAVGLVANIFEAAGSGTAAVFTAETGVGAVGFGSVFLLSVDQAQANARQLWTGQYKTPESVQLLEQAGVNPVAANLLVAGISGGGNIAATVSVEGRLAATGGLMNGRTWRSPLYQLNAEPGAFNTYGGPPLGIRSPLGNSPLLPTEGNVGTARDLLAAGTKGDNLTPHHIPSANHMDRYGISWDDALAMNMEHPFPGFGGRHRATFTNGTQADAYMSARDALAAGVRDSRAIYQRQGLYSPVLRAQFQELIQRQLATYPTIFKKK